MTPAELAARLHRDLSALADGAKWSTTASEGQAQGAYTDPIADAMGNVGVEDLAEASALQLRRVRQLALQSCLDRLELYYANLTDIKVGQRDEKLSQIAAALTRLRGANRTSGGSVGIGFTLRRGPAVDYSTGEGDAEDA